MSAETKSTFGNASFPLSNRLARALWNATQFLLIRFSPRPLHLWRALILRLWGARLGRNCHIYPRANIWAPWNLQAGDESAIADGATIYNQSLISIGRRAVISQGAHLCAGTHDYEDPNFPLVSKPITIHDHAWIAAEAFIHPGITIGEGAVIGARAVVTKDMPPWTICAGHPCEPIKPRALREKLSSTAP
jgi:putative colanic acid biosynthesis acetyltransferase WcaF